ncbi:hypothetical protein EUAN_13940 [Andreesenia angusta]|uniref:Uncharacterized protein n=1 Tax=Andreesenia angusta TaxID=39480 RepID=A0A1S1V743_9FIRM|nr:hypothetical protein [Andreesenia angusta]OHW62324.1 hypothetical protein EUAN_13940 [Andreesenia angusta]
MFFKKNKEKKESLEKHREISKQESTEESDSFKETESLEKKALKGLPDEELAKAIRTVLKKSKLN